MAARPDLSSPFAPPVALDAINSTATDSGPSLSADGLTLYFDSNRGGVSSQLYASQRTSELDAFTTAAPVAGPFTSLADVQSPDLSGDGLSLYFRSTDGGTGAEDLWVATRPSRTAPWDAMTNLSALNTATLDDNPCIDIDDRNMYFTSARLEIANDLFVATRPDSTSAFSAPAVVRMGINLGVGEYGIDISADGTTMVRSINLGPPQNTNIWLVTRACL